jgi:hypothetical protein
MQRVWFEECVDGTSRRELGLVQNAEESFLLTHDGLREGPDGGYRPATGCRRDRANDQPAGMMVVALPHPPRRDVR